LISCHYYGIGNPGIIVFVKAEVRAEPIARNPNYKGKGEENG
jgi:hypothetical protein